MVSNNDFFIKLKSCVEEKTPFISFRHPQSETLKCYFGSANKINSFSIPLDSGFVVMPFDVKKQGYYISKSTTISTKISKNINKDSLNTSLNLNEKFHSDKNEYCNKVSKIIKIISQTELVKVVFSKSFKFNLSSNNFDIFFQKLLNQNFEAFCYLFYHPEEGFWMGASPETLLEINDKNVTTMALAGTKKRETSEWGNKEIIEQEIVKEEIIKNLRPLCENVKTEGPVTIKAGEIDHLKTVITGFSTASVNDVINAIHPTPAVGGVPKKNALSIINSLENHERSLYSGYLGEIDKNGCRLFVNLRCVNFNQNKATLFVGGGITQESSPEKEWEEIINKSQTILSSLFN